MIRAAIFDVFGTVVDWRQGVAAVVARAFEAKGIRIDAPAFADAWRGEYQPAMERIRSGDRGYLPLDNLHFENLRRALAAKGHEGLFDEAELWRLNAAWEQLPPWPDSAPGIAAMREAGLLAAPCSNGSIALMARLARFADLRWDAILGADIARAYKPAGQVYRAAAAAFRLSPDEVVMVAAHNDDLEAARAEGLATAFVPRPREHGEGQTSDLEPTGDWDFVAGDMEVLAGMLGGGEAG